MNPMKWPTREIRSVLIIGLFSVFVTFLIAKLEFIIFQNTYQSSLQIWNKWDTVHYLNLAQNGYLKASQISRYSIPYMPLYPWLIRLTNIILNNYLNSALIISNLCFLVAITYFYKLIRLDFSKNVALRSAIYLAIFPSAYFFHAAYSESLFIMNVILSIYFARKNNWFLSGFFGMFATLSRLNGIVLFPFLLIEYLISKNIDLRNIKNLIPKIRVDFFWLILPPLGFLIFLLLNYYIFGNPYAYMVSLKEDYWEFITVPWFAIIRAYHKFFILGPTDWIMEGAMVVVFWVFGLITMIASIKKLRFSYTIFTTLSLALVSITPTWASMPRFVLCFFPIFIGLGIWGKSKIINFTIIVVSLLLQSIFLSLFIQGHWAF